MTNDEPRFDKITRRDYFVAHVFPALLARFEGTKINWDEIIPASKMIADLLIKELDKKEK